MTSALRVQWVRGPVNIAAEGSRLERYPDLGSGPMRGIWALVSPTKQKWVANATDEDTAQLIVDGHNSFISSWSRPDPITGTECETCEHADATTRERPDVATRMCDGCYSSWKNLMARGGVKV